jgi:hypothetical protein
MQTSPASWSPPHYRTCTSDLSQSRTGFKPVGFHKFLATGPQFVFDPARTASRCRSRSITSLFTEPGAQSPAHPSKERFPANSKSKDKPRQARSPSHLRKRIGPPAPQLLQPPAAHRALKEASKGRPCRRKAVHRHQSPVPQASCAPAMRGGRFRYVRAARSAFSSVSPSVACAS